MGLSGTRPGGLAAGCPGALRWDRPGDLGSIGFGIADRRAPGVMSAGRARRCDRRCPGRDTRPGTSRARVPSRPVPPFGPNDEVVAVASPAVERTQAKPRRIRAGADPNELLCLGAFRMHRIAAMIQRELEGLKEAPEADCARRGLVQPSAGVLAGEAESEPRRAPCLWGKLDAHLRGQPGDLSASRQRPRSSWRGSCPRWPVRSTGTPTRSGRGPGSSRSRWNLIEFATDVGPGAARRPSCTVGTSASLLSDAPTAGAIGRPASPPRCRGDEKNPPLDADRGLVPGEASAERAGRHGRAEHEGDPCGRLGVLEHDGLRD